ncbi:hypothetical protein RCH13_000673 [Chryseobacterium sp. MP_3.2]|nr:hypothetical protein [Chryseobacterium sp. MP_3.2]
MRALILKRERIFHFLCLGMIAASLFLKDPFFKMSLLLLGILGLLILSALKKQKILIMVYSALLVAAGVFFYYLTGGNIQLPEGF